MRRPLPAPIRGARLRRAAKSLAAVTLFLTAAATAAAADLPDDEDAYYRRPEPERTAGPPPGGTDSARPPAAPRIWCALLAGTNVALGLGREMGEMGRPEARSAFSLVADLFLSPPEPQVRYFVGLFGGRETLGTEFEESTALQTLEDTWTVDFTHFGGRFGFELALADWPDPYVALGIGFASEARESERRVCTTVCVDQPGRDDSRAMQFVQLDVGHRASLGGTVTLGVNLSVVVWFGARAMDGTLRAQLTLGVVF